MSYEKALKDLIKAMHIKMAQGHGDKKISIQGAIESSKEESSSKPELEEKVESKESELSEELKDKVKQFFNPPKEEKKDLLTSFGRKPLGKKKK